MTLNVPGYRVIELLHEGKNSRVYRAIHMTDGAQVALKTPATPFPSGGRLTTFRKEFFYLSNQLALVPDLPRSIESFEYGSSIVNVIGYLPGMPLAYLKRQQELELCEAIYVFKRLSSILSAVHRQRVIHQDVNPSNILYHPTSGNVFLIDFNSACDLPINPEPKRISEQINGTLAYISPEQTGRINRAVDFRSDIYTLGISMYEVITGQLPFTTTDVAELVHSHIAHIPPRPEKISDSVPSVLSDIIMRCLAKDPSERYQSAAGLHHDLATCLQDFENSGGFKSFSIGTKDSSNQILFPQKLYGRGDAFSTLQEYYREATQGSNAIVLVAGESGIGKTSLVRELNRTIAIDYGYVTSGKYDQYNRSQPYSAIIQAFSILIQQILTEDESAVAEWKTRVTQALGVSSGLMAKVIPALALLLTSVEPLKALSPTQAKTLIRGLFLKLIQAFGASGRPVVVFLDDLQWADASSLDLIEQFGAMESSSQIFFVGAYRSNEVDAYHPLIQMRDVLRQKGVLVAELELKPLDISGLQAFLSDLFFKSPQEVEALTQLLFKKTNGNPLFVRTLLLELYESGTIWNQEDQGWDWNLNEISSSSYADNVLEVVQARMENLPKSCKSILQLAASIGGTFSLDRVASLSKLGRDQAASALRPAFSQSLIIADDEDVALYDHSHAQQIDEVTCHFTHDRIQQAAYGFLPPEQRDELHLRIGRILHQELKEKTASTKEIAPLLFDVVDHMKKASSLLVDRAEQLDIAVLALKAGQKMKDATAFSDSARILSFAHLLAGEDAWSKNYRLICDICLEYAESLYLCGLYDDAVAIHNSIARNAVDVSDKLRLYNIQSKQYHSQAHYTEAISVGINGLRSIGLSFPESDFDLESRFQDDLTSIRGVLSGRDPQNLEELPENNDPNYLHTQELLFSLFVDAYLLGRSKLCNVIASTMTRLVFEKGQNLLTSIAYINFANALCSSGLDRSLGFSFGKLAISLADKYQAPTQQNFTYHVFALGINHWKDRLSVAHEIWVKASKLALASGSPYAGYVYHQLAHILLITNAPLAEVEEQLRVTRAFLLDSKLVGTIESLQINIGQPVKHLLGQTYSMKSLDDDHFRVESFLNDPHNSLHFKGGLYCAMFRVDCLCGNILSFEELQDRIAVPEVTEQGQMTFVNAWFYYSLLLIDAYRAESSSAKKLDISNAFDRALERMESWAALCNETFGYRVSLLQAETPQTRSVEDIIDLYDKSIKEALKNGFAEGAGLAAERAARFWLRRGKPHLARTYLDQCCAYYSRWGAVGMVDYIRSTYREYLNTVDKNYLYPESVTTTATVDDSWGSVERGLSHNLDLSTVVKAIQAISEYMSMEELCKRLVNIAVESAGATHGSLVNIDMRGKIAVFSNADASIEADESTQNETRDINVSKAVISYVSRTGKSLLLKDAITSEILISCRYIHKFGVRSICCVPIRRSGASQSVLYLEHRSLSGAFREEQLQLVEILATQAVICLENTERQKLARARDAAEAASHAKSQFLATMSHEIRTPMNGVLGFAELLAQTALDSEQQEFLQHVRQSGQLLLNLLSDILDLSKMEADAMTLEEVDIALASLVEETMALIASKAAIKQLRLGLWAADDVPKCMIGDPTRLQQIILNLVSNAIKFTQKGGVIVEIHAPAEPNPDIQTPIELHVVDTGIGIPEDKIDGLFDAFTQADASTTRHFGGTGLGLSICKKLCKLMGGDIRAESQVGNGSRFIARFYLTKKYSAIPNEPPLLGKRVLVFDSFDYTREATRKELELNGAEVMAVGAYDIDLVTQIKPDLVLIDVDAAKKTDPVDAQLSSARWFIVTEEPKHRIPAGFVKAIVRPVRASKLVSTPNTPKTSSFVEEHALSLSHPLRVLVAEDNPTNQTLMRHLFTKIYKTNLTMVTNGQEAVEAFAKLEFDIVFMDVQMPKMDGLEATRVIRATTRGASIPIVALTANSSNEAVQECLAAGMSKHLAKPIQRSQLNATLKEVNEQM